MLVAAQYSGATFAFVSTKERKERELVDPATRLAESTALRDLFDTLTEATQTDFGATYGIGTQGAVWQFLRNKRPLNMKAAIGFAKGLGVPIRSFSPRLADLADLASSLNQIEPGTPAAARKFAIEFAAASPANRERFSAVWAVLKGDAVPSEEVEAKMPATAPSKAKK